jgi:hypothetical protein
MVGEIPMRPFAPSQRGARLERIGCRPTLRSERPLVTRDTCCSNDRTAWTARVGTAVARCVTPALRAAEAGFDRHLVKPVHFTQRVDVLNNGTARSRRGSPA